MAVAVFAISVIVLATVTTTTAASASSTTAASPGGEAAASHSMINKKGDRCYQQAGRGTSHGICIHRVTGRSAVIRKAQALKVRPHNKPVDLAPAAVPAPPSQCGFPDYYYVDPDRFTMCTWIDWELYTYTSSSGTTQITGSLNFADQQWTSYSATSGTWTHGLTLNSYEGEGTLANGAPALVYSTCDPVSGFSEPCTVAGYLGTTDGTQVTLAPDSTFNDGWTEQDSVLTAGSGQVDYQNQLGFTLQGIAATGIPAWSFTDAYLTGRCDSTATSSSVGCVNQNFTPTLSISKAQGGASAAMVQWAQQELSGHWGLQGEGGPLHYLPTTSANRDVICDDGSFIPDQNITNALAPYGTTDSCDEFPFNGTYESGAMMTDVNGAPKPYVTTGADCAQVTAEQTGFTNNPDNLATDWPTVTVDGTPTLSEPCVRGHIPNRLNSSVGGSYGRFVQTQRLVDKDPFWLTVTS